MTKLTDSEREGLQRLAQEAHQEPPLRDQEQFVAPTVEARARYIRFATLASRFHRGDKPLAVRWESLEAVKSP